jgi:hypothetical protein
MGAGASSGLREVRADRSASVSGAGAKRPPSQSFAMRSTSKLRSSFSMPSTRARGVSSFISHADDARRRNTS